MSTHSFEESNLQTIIEKISRDEGFTKPKFDITIATKPGDNFISRVFRIEVSDENDKEKSLSLILKASTPNRERQMLTSSDKLFQSEAEMYTEILPALNDLLNKKDMGGAVFPGTVRCFGFELNDGLNEEAAEIIVLDDKKGDGYIKKSRTEGFDVEHCRLILEKLALFHATFMALRVLDPEKAASLHKLIHKKLWTNDPTHIAAKDFGQVVSVGFKMLEDPYKPGNPVYDKLQKMVEDFPNFFVKMNEVPEDGLAVIAHGDCHTNNILFKYAENGKLEDVLLIDFQIARVCSPVVDLTYVLMICTTKDMRDKHYEYLIKYYYDSVTKILRSLDCDPEEIIPWERFQKHLKLYGQLGVALGLMGLPLFLAEWTAEMDVHSAEKSTDNVFANAPKLTPESSKEATRRINELVSDAVQWGYI